MRTFHPEGALPAADAAPQGFALRPHWRPQWWTATNGYALFVIAQCWLVTLVVVNPIGDFPIIDDWAYLVSVRSVIEHGRFEYSDWTAANLVSQIAWGALFAWPFGVSYTVLRFSTEVLSLVAAGAVYLTLLKLDCRPGIALSGALIFLFNPLVVPLSASFMSDVPYTAMQAVAMLFLIGALRTESGLQLRAGWWTAVLALFCRQVAMAIPLGFGAAKLARERLGASKFAFAILPFAGFAALQIAFQAGLDFLKMRPAEFARQIDSIGTHIRESSAIQLVIDTLRFVLDCWYYLGLFLLPLSILAIAQFSRALPRGAATLLWTWLIGLTLLLVWFGPQMPIWSNTINLWSLGGPDIAGVPPSGFLWPVITVFAVFGALAMLPALALAGISIAGQRRTDTGAAAGIFAGVTALALLGSMALLQPGMRFDRYIIPVIPCGIILVSMGLRGTGTARQAIPVWASILSGAALVATGIYSVLGTHDYLAEKRAQWTAVQDLVRNDHVLADTIDAGWVYNAPTSFGVYGDPKQMGTWFRTQDYLVYSERIAGILTAGGYSPLRFYPVERWAPWAQAPGSIVVMHRNTPPQGRARKD